MARNFLGVLLITSSLATAASALVVHVNSECGTDLSSCISTHLKGESNLTILLEADVKLQGVILFENVTNIAINGSQLSTDTAKQVQCTNQGGNLYFKHVSKVTISNVIIVSCGALDDETQYEAALLFKNSSNITLVNTTMYKSRLTGIAFLACSGDILLQSVLLLENGYGQRCFSFPAGVSIEITDSNVTANYTLRDCDVKYNQGADISECDNTTQANSDIHWHGRGLGGGIGVYFTGKCSSNRVSINNANISNNRGKWGGGIYLQFQDFTENNNVSVEWSTFQNNSAYSAGGGVNIVYLNDQALENRTNRVTFHKVDLIKNYARYGGGMAISSGYGNKIYTPGGNLVFSHCTFRRNIALYSPAIDLSPYFHKHTRLSRFLPIPLFSNVDISENVIKSAEYKLKQTSKIIIGVFSVLQFTVYFAERVNFVGNRFSALLLSSAMVVFGNGTLSVFSNNYSGNGGGIAMYGYSVIVLSADIHIEFLENKAAQYGGGIFYQTSDQHNFITGTSCFLQHEHQGIPVEKRNITLIFRGNMAESGGSSVYADSFYRCQFYCHGNHRPPITENIMQCIGNVTMDDTAEDQSRLQSSSSEFHFSNNDTEYFVIPGAKHAIPFYITDEFNQTVSPLMNVGVSTHNTSIQVSPKYTLTNEITPRGYPSDTATLHFITQGIAGIYFRFNLSLLDCPPGFYFSNDSEALACVCSVDSSTNTSLYKAITYCNFTSFRAHMKRSYWAGYIPTTAKSYKKLFFSPCFPPLCKDSVYLPNSSADLPSAVCVENRKGIMCGECSEEHSSYFHSKDYSCKPNYWCHLGPLFFLLSEILPVFILFAVIVIFDFSFTTGNTVGFIFFSQYLDRLTVHIDDFIPYYRKEKLL